MDPEYDAARAAANDARAPEGLDSSPLRLARRPKTDHRSFSAIRPCPRLCPQRPVPQRVRAAVQGQVALSSLPEIVASGAFACAARFCARHVGRAALRPTV